MGPTTDIEIMSNAAVILGKSAFTTIEDADEFAVSLQKFYDMLVPSELSKVHWKFSKKQQELSLVSGFDPDFAQFTSAYDLPADFLSAVRVYPSVHYQIFGKRIYTSTTGKLQMEYNYQVPVTYWSNPFKEYMVFALASAAAMSVTENPSLVQMVQNERHRARAEAMWVDAQNSPNVPFQSQPWIECRQFGASSIFRGRR